MMTVGHGDIEEEQMDTMSRRKNEAEKILYPGFFLLRHRF